MDCIFCKIVKGEIPCYKIYEDENALAFLDISCDGEGHTLVIPKVHAENIFDVPKPVLCGVMQAVQKVANHYKEIGYEGVNILNASGESAEQTVMHLHFHILPRSKNNTDKLFPNLKKNKLDLAELQKKLKF